MSQEVSVPGSSWVEIIRRPTLEEFAAAFVEKVVLETSVGSRALVGARAIRYFFDATRAMYETIAFTHEANTGNRSYLEWEGAYQGAAIAGMTILTRNAEGKITSIRLFHRPYDQIIAFSAGLADLLQGKIDPGVFH
ncbi:nuclear transport factor 2 family protein [Undibacterium terreum]|nr:nuclear transport factor 2 family protein [Undibacterium terreum]